MTVTNRPTNPHHIQNENYKTKVEMMDRITTSNDLPVEVVLALNKAKTSSWRLGVAWVIVSSTNKVMVCNGEIFNQHVPLLIKDVQSHIGAKKLFLSYCPLVDDLYSLSLLNALQTSSLVEVHVCVHGAADKQVSELSNRIAIPVTPWRSDSAISTQNHGLAWVRSTQKPWVHIVCSNGLGGGEFPLNKMSDHLGVSAYVALKGIESTVLYVQNDKNNPIGKQLNLANPHFVESCPTLIRYLTNLTAALVSVVTVVCDPKWLAIILEKGLANEVSYFLSLSSSDRTHSSTQSIVDFPEEDGWMITSSEVKGNYMQVVLQRSLNSAAGISKTLNQKEPNQEQEQEQEQ